VNVGTPGSSGALDGREMGYELGLDAFWHPRPNNGIALVMDAAAAIASGIATTVLIAVGEAQIYTARESTAPWTRPEHEFVTAYGLFTAAHFALQARRHMLTYGVTSEHLARVSSVIRNNGHINPEAAYYGRGPFTPADILNSRMVADPFHLLDCSMTSEGGCGLVLTTAERARDLRQKPVHILAGGVEAYAPAYTHPPVFDESGWAGKRTAERCFGLAGITPEDVDTCELYDAFSWEIIRQFEAFGFCQPGEGKDLVMSDDIVAGGKWPVCTDGGTMAHAHTGSSQMLQKVVQCVRQVRGQSPVNQVPGCRVSLCSNSGAGAMNTTILIAGDAPP
jgi:acetyl-CoA acetyltransferase